MIRNDNGINRMGTVTVVSLFFVPILKQFYSFYQFFDYGTYGVRYQTDYEEYGAVRIWWEEGTNLGQFPTRLGTKK